MRCKYCGSKLIHPDKQHQTFSKGKAAIGAAAVGVVGVAAGMIGKDIQGYSCGACGAFMEAPMDASTEIIIDKVIRVAESGADSFMYDFYKKQYPNISADIPQPAQNAAAAQPAAYTETVEAPVEAPAAAPAAVPADVPGKKIKYTFRVLSWQRSCPMVIETAVISATASGDCLSLRAHNTGSKTIRSVYYKVRVLDDTGDEISTVSCVYQGVSVAPRASLPADKKFPLNTDLAFRVELFCEKLAMEDGTVWRADDSDMPITLQEQPLLTEANCPQVKYARMELWTVSQLDAESELYMPLQQENYWQCICGTPVENGCSCPRCGAQAASVIAYLQQDHLRKIGQNYIRRIAAARAEETTALYNRAYSAKMDEAYGAAEVQMSMGSIGALINAAAAFEQIAEWKDAAGKAADCRCRISELQEQEYQNAVRAIEQAESVTQCQAAQKRFKALRSYGDYKDCIEKEKACEEKKNKILDAKRKREEIAKAEAEARVAAAAKKTKIIVSVAAAIVVLCIAAVVVLTKVILPKNRYAEATTLMENGQYEEAISKFRVLNGYKDSREQLKECQYLNAGVLIDSGDYIAAHDILTELNGYKDTEALLDSIALKYNIACINAAQVGDTVYFGSYEQDNDTTDGQEKIEWIVLAKEDDRAIVISKFILDNQPWNYTYTAPWSGVLWEDCSLRRWLNDTFYSNAFTTEEQMYIRTTTVTEEDHDGHATEDKVFLLSSGEAQTFLGDKKDYSLTDANGDNYDGYPDLQCAPSDYAVAQGSLIYAYTTSEGNATSTWWLRNSGWKCVGSDGEISDNVSIPTKDGVRPAMWISLREDTAAAESSEAPDNSETPDETETVTENAEASSISESEEFPITGTWYNEEHGVTLTINDDGTLHTKSDVVSDGQVVSYVENDYTWTSEGDIFYFVGIEQTSQYQMVEENGTYQLVGESITYTRTDDSATNTVPAENAASDTMADSDTFPISGTWLNENGRGLYISDDGTLTTDFFSDSDGKATECKWTTNGNVFSYESPIGTYEFQMTEKNGTYQLVGESVTYTRTGNPDS